MTALRQFSAVYVVVAIGYATAMMFSAHPLWKKNAEQTTAYLGVHGYRTVVAIDDDIVRPGWNLAEGTGRAIFAGKSERVARGERLAAPKALRANVIERMTVAVPKRFARRIVVARTTVPAPSHHLAPPEIDRGDLPMPPRPPEASLPSKSFTLAPSVAPPAPVPPPTAVASVPHNAPAAAGDIIRVTERLRENLTSEMLANFDLFLYVSKADTGPWAQHMYVFQKQKSGDLSLLYNWPVSTGREKMELDTTGHRLSTETPPGYYELDPRRAYEHYDSAQWGKPMPYAMFFNWVKDGNETGLAIHAASGEDVPLLGQRASAGCIHLSADNARALFTLIRDQYRGLAPRFAVDRRTGTMSNDGILLHNPDGHLKMADGYKVLIFIEDFGGQNVVAALY